MTPGTMEAMTPEEREREREKDQEAMMIGLVFCGLELWIFAVVLFAHWIGVV